MILRGGTKPVPFIASIDATIGKEYPADDLVEQRIARALDDVEGVIYLADGYWRAVPLWNETTVQLEGIRLINPDRTRAECAIVEQAIAILHHWEYRP